MSTLTDLAAWKRQHRETDAPRIVTLPPLEPVSKQSTDEAIEQILSEPLT